MFAEGNPTPVTQESAGGDGLPSGTAGPTEIVMVNFDAPLPAEDVTVRVSVAPDTYEALSPAPVFVVDDVVLEFTVDEATLTDAFAYDRVGRMVSRTSVDAFSEPSSQASWVFDTEWIGAVTSESAVTVTAVGEFTVDRVFDYDGFGRQVSVTTTLPGGGMGGGGHQFAVCGCSRFRVAAHRWRGAFGADPGFPG